ncbi:hypothetical protein FGO68_gene6382 [Halteria grandinella]|uniref:Uncharacterized protein n=1 Tax=Halteria grandinella TaxID=5974 RepID=A0A8J8NUN3_HALGN|nr:hypothetical protein FGO68_gene6382 [Halteria grandinella]
MQEYKNKGTYFNQIQEKQEDCKCGRGDQVRYYCAQKLCEDHQDNTFFCDDCFKDIMRPQHQHYFLRIPDLFLELKKNWMDLSQRVGQLHRQALAIYKSQQSIFDCLDAQVMKRNDGLSRLVGRDIARFDQFHQDFKEYVAKSEEYAQNFSVTKLHSLNDKYEAFTESLDNDFGYLADIGKPDFLYDNYSASIPSCPIPFDDDQLKVKVLELKFRLGNSCIQAAEEAKSPSNNPQDLNEVVKNLIN